MYIDKVFASVGGGVLALGGLMVFAKSDRIRAADDFDSLVQAKFRAAFWRRGSEFTKSLNGLIHESIAEDPERLPPPQEREAATQS
jgi:hypothetical protein